MRRGGVRRGLVSNNELVNSVTSTRQRTLLKSVSYHILAFMVDVPVFTALNVYYYHLPFYSVIVTVTGVSAMIELVLHTGLLYWFDRLWKHINWGKVVKGSGEADGACS